MELGEELSAPTLLGGGDGGTSSSDGLCAVRSELSRPVCERDKLLAFDWDADVEAFDVPVLDGDNRAANGLRDPR